MASSKPTLIIPSETQLREFDPKLLLGCVAAERGYPVIVGSQTHIHLKIASLPRGIYFAKDLQGSKVRILNILEKIGSKVVAWDEEGLVPYPPPRYYKKRICLEALRHVSLAFAWGKAYAELFKGFPGYDGTPIHVTGNPRIDLLRPELRVFFSQEAKRLRQRFGKFILVNTNFGVLNHYIPNLTSFKSESTSSSQPESDIFWNELCAHRSKIFYRFQEILPSLSKAVSGHTIIVRPHPSENHKPWKDAVSGCDNVQIIHEGNVIPWLMAAQVLIHNSCTTGVEAFLVGTPSIAFQPVTSEVYDRDLPNGLGYQAFSFGELEETLKTILGGQGRGFDATERQQKAQYHMAALDGPLASDRIVDVLDQEPLLHGGIDGSDIGQYLQGWMQAQYRAVTKVIKSKFPGNKNSADYQQRRFPGISLGEVQNKMGNFRQLLGRFERVAVKEISNNIFFLTKDESIKRAR